MNVLLNQMIIAAGLWKEHKHQIFQEQFENHLTNFCFTYGFSREKAEEILINYIEEGEVSCATVETSAGT
ncbi:hypothetical protein [Paenisporosarcina cavernae]|uniref:Uncharacterized protein n=1 Tax=Paenisporosarcina cavernae TaxID=2320858 RepID=A0A385YVQ6_9BACL|nr:hypothetical protein [Paenisporosarcina cavernae]AYC29662.1 hypothetical protein D3873_07075 [Paenisporosarcina cavernae]